MPSVFADPRGIALAVVAVALAAAPADANVERAAAAGPLSARERASISASLAFVREHEGRREAYVVAADGSAERPLDPGPWQSYPAAAAPDGALAILRVVDRGEDHEESLVVREPGGATTILARAPQVRNPSFSPDGASIAFESSDASFRDIHRAARTGKDVVRLTDDPEGNYEPTFTADGRSLVFTSSRDGEAEIYRMGSDGSVPVRLTRSPGDDLEPRPSPDGRYVAFISARDGVDRVYVMRQDGTDARPVRPPSGADSEREHRWSPDGTRLAFVARAPNAKSRVLVWDVARDAITAVTDGSAIADMPAFSPDGRHLAFVSDTGGGPDVLLARADGTGAVRVAAAEGKRWLPVWIPEVRATLRK